jgi:hypothetical protein
MLSPSPPVSPPVSPPGPSARPAEPLAAAPSRASELLFRAAAHRTFVEKCLAAEKQQNEEQQQLAEMIEQQNEEQQQLAEMIEQQNEEQQQLAEMIEGWMTGEDALEVACWHMESQSQPEEAPCASPCASMRPPEAQPGITCAHGKTQHMDPQARGPAPGTPPRPDGPIAQRQAISVQDSSPVPHAKLLIAAEERRRQGDAGKGRPPPSSGGERAEATKQKEWTPEEDELVLELVEEIGTKWSEIVEYLPGRTNNGVKNHFYSSMRKKLRQQQRAEAEAAKAWGLLAAPPKQTGKRKRWPDGPAAGG